MSSSGTLETERLLDKMSPDEVARYLTDPNDPQFSWAICALQRKGEAAIPQWCKLMGRDDLGTGWITAPLALVALGDKGLPSLIELLKGEDRTARRTAAWALMKRNKPCHEVIAPLIDLLKGTDEEAAGYAAAALIPNGKEATAAVPYLIPLAFRLTYTLAPCMAVEAFGLAPDQIPSVIDQVATEDQQMKSKGWRTAIGARLLAATDQRSAAVLAKALGHKNQAVRLATAEAVQRLGRKIKNETLEKALNEAITLDDTRVEAAAALVAIGASAKAAVPGLIRDLEKGQVMLLRTTNLRYRCRAAEVLATIPESLPALIDGLASEKQMVRIGCVWALPGDKATAAQFLPKIRSLIACSTLGYERELIVEKLYKVDPNWVRRAATQANVHGEWPPRHWRDVANAVTAMAKAEIEKEGKQN